MTSTLFHPLPLFPRGSAFQGRLLAICCCRFVTRGPQPCLAESAERSGSSRQAARLPDGNRSHRWLTSVACVESVGRKPRISIVKIRRFRQRNLPPLASRSSFHRAGCSDNRPSLSCARSPGAGQLMGQPEWLTQGTVCPTMGIWRELSCLLVIQIFTRSEGNKREGRVGHVV